MLKNSLLVVLVFLLVAGCVSSSRFKHLENRVTELETRTIVVISGAKDNNKFVPTPYMPTMPMMPPAPTPYYWTNTYYTNNIPLELSTNFSWTNIIWTNINITNLIFDFSTNQSRLF